MIPKPLLRIHWQTVRCFSVTVYRNKISGAPGKRKKETQWYFLFEVVRYDSVCCNMGQNDTVGKIELKPSIVLSSDNTNCKNDIQLFHQLFDELSVHTDYH